MDEIFAVLYYNSIHKRSSFSKVFDGDSIVSKSEDLLFFYPYVFVNRKMGHILIENWASCKKN